MSIDQRIIKATEQLEKDVELTYEIVNGDDTTEVMTAGGPVPSHAKVAKDSHDEIIGQLKPTVSSINELASFVSNKATEADTSADRAEAAADRADEIAGLETVRDALRLAAVPLPDFWLPLNDNLMIREGVGTPYQEGLPLYHADFTRSTEKIYVSKRGKLKIAKIDEPAFESEGLLFEGISKNYISNSNNNDWHEDPRGIFVKSSYSCFKSYKIKINEDSNNTFSIGCEIPLIKDLSAGDKVTYSVYFRRISGRMRFRIRFSDPVFRGDRSIYTDTVTPFPGNDNLFRSNVTRLDDHWFRFSTTRTVDASVENNQLRAEANILLADSEFGAETEFLLPQYEQLPFESSPIATTNEPLTRNPDNLVILGDNLIFGDKSVVATWSIISDSVDDVSASSRKHIFGADSEYIGAFIHIGDLDSTIKKQYVFDGDSTLVSAALKNNSGVLAYVKNGMNLTNYLDGENISSQLTKDYLVKRDNRFSIGSTIVGSQPRSPTRYLWGHVKNFMVWNHALTSEQMAAIG